MLTLRRLLIASALILVALAGFIFIRNLIDFPVYYAAGQSLLAGRSDLYAGDFARGRVMDYRYPPFFLLSLAPLWTLSYKLAAYVWYILGILQIAVCVFAVEKASLPGQPPQVRSASVLTEHWRVWLLVFLCVAQYFVMVLHYGNAHLLAVTLMIAAFYLAMRGKDLMPALLIAVAITIKVIPVLLLPYFALRRRWRFLVLTATFTVGLNLLPAAYFGFARNMELVRTWYDHVIANQEFHELNGPINLSLKGQLRRYLTEIDYSARVDGDVGYPSVNLMVLPAEVADRIWLISIVILFTGCLALIVAARGSPHNEGLALGLMICLMLLAGPITSKIYFIALIWPLVILARRSSESRVIASGLILLAVINSVLPLLPGRSTQRLLLVLGIDFFATCLVLVLCAYNLILLKRAGSYSPTKPPEQQ